MNPSDNKIVRIGIDAMGGDHNPAVAVEAVRLAAEAEADLHCVLFGDETVLDPAVAALPRALRQRIEAVATGKFVPMDSSPAQAMRRGAGTSMFEALAALARDDIDAMVSSGNTGALMALARSALGTLPGIERPALMSAFPVGRERVWVLDLGANIGVNAERLCEFAVLGSAAVSMLIGRKPRIGLLNIGTEPSKGPDVVREAARLIQLRALDFIGFVEGHDVFQGVTDVVVCDGFAGNILLKTAEGAVGMLIEGIEADFRGSLIGRLATGRLRRTLKRLDPTQYNGASLLGINGIVIKSHGHAGPKAVASAVSLAALEVRRQVLPELERQLWAND